MNKADSQPEKLLSRDVPGQRGTSRRLPAHREGLWRPAVVVMLLIGLYFVNREFGLTDIITTDSIRRLAGTSGPWGILFFFAVFTIGLLLHVPGFVFVGGGIVAYGQTWGGVLSFACAVGAVSASFIFVRALGGRFLASIERPFITRMLSRLDARPVTTIVILRMLFWMSPPLNYALALTGVRFQDYLVGSALGLILPVTIITISMGWMVS